MLEPRTAVMILVEASWEDEHGAPQTVPACMEDKSVGGACIRLKTRIAAGTRIRVGGQWQQFAGVTRYCRPDGRDFVVGIQRDTAKGPAVDPTAIKEARRKAARKHDYLTLAASLKAIPVKKVPSPRVVDVPTVPAALTEIKTEPIGLEVRNPVEKPGHEAKKDPSEGATQPVVIVSSLPQPQPQPVVTQPVATQAMVTPPVVAREEVVRVKAARGEITKPEAVRPKASKPEAATGEVMPPPTALVPAVAPVLVRAERPVIVLPAPNSRSMDGRTEVLTEFRTELRTEIRTERRSEIRFDPRPESAPQPPVAQHSGKERKSKSMARKWLEKAPWRSKPDSLDADPNAIATSNANHGGKPEKENFMRQNNASPNDNLEDHPSDELGGFQVELTPTEDIYRAAGIMMPRKGYTIKKVVEMLNSEHLRPLSQELKRVAVLMALDAAGVPLEEVLADATARQQALDAHEAEQKKRAEAEWARKAEENAQIEAELERLKVHHQARINRNIDAVAREKATFNSWVISKQQESQSMAEAAELCLKAPALAAAAVEPTPAPAAPKALAKTV